MANLLDDLKDKVEKMSKEMDSFKALIDEYSKEVSSECKKIKKEIDGLLNSSLASPQNWDESKEKHDEIIKKVEKDLPEKVRIVKDSLPQATSGLVVGIKEAKRVVITGIIFLILITGLYVSLHYCPMIPSYNKDNAAQFFKAIGKVKAAIVKSEVIPSDVVIALGELDDEKGMKGNRKDLKKDILTSELSERLSYLKGFVSTFEIDAKSVPQNDQRLVEMKKEIERIEKKANGLANNDGFFWITGSLRWLEIVFWGEFGVIVGILVWVSTEVQAGKYTKLMYEKEKFWYLTEIVIGPIVVVAVFFLLKQFVGTLIEGITEEEVSGSIYMTLGLSFALGLFLRRTLGIFDSFKKKMPLPSS